MTNKLDAYFTDARACISSAMVPYEGVRGGRGRSNHAHSVLVEILLVGVRAGALVSTARAELP